MNDKRRDAVNDEDWTDSPYATRNTGHSLRCITDGCDAHRVRGYVMCKRCLRNLKNRRKTAERRKDL